MVWCRTLRANKLSPDIALHLNPVESWQVCCGWKCAGCGRQGCPFSLIFRFFPLLLARSETHLYVNILYFFLCHLSLSVSFCVHFL